MFVKNRKTIFRIIAVTMMCLGCSFTTHHMDKLEVAIYQVKVRNILSDALIEINAIKENKESSQEQPALTTQMVSDFLQMDSEEFQNKYDKNELYIQNILYCNIDDWKYHGMQLDAFQDKEDYYDVIDINAIRFRDQTEEMNIFGKYGRESIKSDWLYVKALGDFAISIYKPEGTGNQERGSESEMAEISFVKINLREGTAPEELYSFLENDYYKVREEIQEEQWVQSPDGTRAACVSNGSLPKHPAQIFIRYAEEVPDDVFRRTWECRIVGWIDEEHLVCYDLDRYPILISLEKKQVEIIKKEEDDYDAYGAEYIIDGNSLVCKVLGEEVYQWKIVREGNEVKFVGDSEKILDGQE